MHVALQKTEFINFLSGKKSQTCRFCHALLLLFMDLKAASALFSPHPRQRRRETGVTGFQGTANGPRAFLPIVSTLVRSVSGTTNRQLRPEERKDVRTNRRKEAIKPRKISLTSPPFVRDIPRHRRRRRPPSAARWASWGRPLRMTSRGAFVGACALASTCACRKKTFFRRTFCRRRKKNAADDLCRQTF